MHARQPKEPASASVALALLCLEGDVCRRGRPLTPMLDRVSQRRACTFIPPAPVRPVHDMLMELQAQQRTSARWPQQIRIGCVWSTRHTRTEPFAVDEPRNLRLGSRNVVVVAVVRPGGVAAWELGARGVLLLLLYTLFECGCLIV